MSSNSTLIENFNSLNFKRILSMKELAINLEYLIGGAYRTSTKFGEKVVLQLNDGVLYLPSRFNSLSEDDIKRLNEGSFSITKVPLKEGAEITKLVLNEILITPDTFYVPY